MIAEARARAAQVLNDSSLLDEGDDTDDAFLVAWEDGLN